jgi:hypothetical protein
MGEAFEPQKLRNKQSRNSIMMKKVLFMEFSSNGFMIAKVL